MSSSQTLRREKNCEEVRPPPLFILATPHSNFFYGVTVIYI